MGNENLKINEEELYKKHHKLQTKYASRICGAIFIVIGLIFLTLGIVFLCLGVRDEDGFLVGLVFTPMGGFFTILGIVFCLVLGLANKDYKKYKERISKYGFWYSYDMMIALSMQQEKIEILEKRIELLEKQLTENNEND